jgi:N-methylhydantoinase B/oxoprolinase/acetone carboxylase alpha subunit
MRTDKHRIAPVGIDGGKNGETGACIVNPGAEDEKRLPSRFGDYTLGQGDLLRLERPGGGGMGNPFERRPKEVLEDVRQGYVSAASAKADYGVALVLENGEWTVDEEATRLLRKNKKIAGKETFPLL